MKPYKKYKIEWKHFKRYLWNGEPTDYFVAKNGDVFSFKSLKEIKSYITSGGYENIDIRVRGKIIKKGKHQMVAETYIPNPENKPTVNHKNGDKSNNDFDNLEWATHSEQLLHAYENELRIPVAGEDVHFSVRNNAQIEEACKLLSEGISMTEVYELTGVPVKDLSAIRNGKIWKSISCKYEFPISKYPQFKGERFGLRDDIEKLILGGHTNREICDMIDDLEQTPKIRKKVSDMRYQINKVQRLEKAKNS